MFSLLNVSNQTPEYPFTPRFHGNRAGARDPVPRAAAAPRHLLQLRGAAGRGLPARDQGAVGQVPRPGHRDDHHQDWQVCAL